MEQQIAELEKQIYDEEYFLNGIKLYYRLIPAAIRWTNTGSFKRITSRMTAAINRAKTLVSKYRHGEDISDEILRFRWPERLTSMENRVKTVQLAWFASGVKEEDPDKMTKAELMMVKEKVSQFI
jgi:hypothetical protein